MSANRNYWLYRLLMHRRMWRTWGRTLDWRQEHRRILRNLRAATRSESVAP
jgi:hypothetical protein